MTISVVLADDHAIVREGVRALLTDEPDFTIVGEADDGLAAVRFVERLQPDLLVLDLRMPRLNGLEALRIVTQRSPKTRVVVLSVSDNEAVLLEALRNGAIAYVHKGCTAQYLVQALRLAMAGQYYLSPPFCDQPAETYLEQARAIAQEAHDTLTPRERELLNLAAAGNTNAQIASRLFLSSRTVEMHRSSMMRKLGLRNQADLIRYAIKRGIIPSEQ